MRTIVGVLVSGLVGVVLAVAATVAIVQANEPDREAKKLIESRSFRQPTVVEYGRR